ncbi:hypothetical protein BD770DRAFT_156719 [Pilaira anomala]|nr:hypothetical protein BD770DRAFT_156719 [Pilaira anomala]
MTLLSSNQPLTTYLPSLFQRKSSFEEDHLNTSNTIFKDYQMVYDYQHKMSTTTDILLPPILTSVASPVPLSPPNSCCSSNQSVSSFPSSPNSSSANSFNSFSTKKGSIQSLLNSGSELLALEKEELLNGYFQPQEKKKKRSWASESSSINKKQKTLVVVDQEVDNRQIKGLRLFSKQVCDKVAEKKTTTYNEVADELAADIQRNNSHHVDIITKDRKEIKWLGINHNEQDLLQQEIKNEELRQKLLLDSIQKNKSTYHDTWNNLNRLKQLVKRNQIHQQQQQQQQQLIHLPFFMIQGKGEIETHYNYGNEACLSTTSSSFAIYQDIDILTKIWPSSTTVS